MTARCAVRMIILALGASSLASSAAARETTVPPPPNLAARVGLGQKLGAPVPLDLTFRDARGATLRLREALAARPTVIVPGYFGCTNLCSVVRAGLARAVEASGLEAGEQFNVVVFSIDPRESSSDAAVAQHGDARAYPAARISRWRYLIGAPRASAALAQALGFRYLFDPRNGQYAHAAGAVVLSPLGTVTQYLPGVQFAPLTLRLALVGASRGRIGSVIDRVLLLCCDYDPSTGRYSLLISRILQALGLLTAVTLGGLILALRRAEARERARSAP